MHTNDFLSNFLQQQQLPENYLHLAEKWYEPLAQTIQQRAKLQQRPLLVAINGCQGSGKSTLSAYLETVLAHKHQLSVAVLSIDDFYLQHQTRQQLGKDIHPLMKTRGVPGTHDTEMLTNTLEQLTGPKGQIALPRFDKAQDDRAPARTWPKVTLPLDVVILEGWCMGAQATPEHALRTPCNPLEEKEDPEGLWRGYVNDQLRAHYLPIFEQFNLWVMLKAPTFDNVFQWRLEQEQKLAARQNADTTTRIMSEAEIQRFIQHYQRLTENCLSKLSTKVHFLYTLDNKRQPQSLDRPLPLDQTAKFLTQHPE